MKKTDELVRPSALPKLQECRCYVSQSSSSDAAKRGTALDAIIREAWAAGTRELAQIAEPWTEADREACNFALQHLALLSHGEHVETREEELQAVVPVDGVKAGTMDALCAAEGWLVDFKTGQVRDYHAQMAAYALACMDAYFADEWTSHLIFVDQKQVVSHHWTRAEAEQLVSDIANAPQVPTLCEYCCWCGAAETCTLLAQKAQEVTSTELVPLTAELKKSGELPPSMEVLAGDHAAAHDFLTKLGIVNDWAELLKKKLREQLSEDDAPASKYFNRIVVAGRKSVPALSLGKYWEEFGWQRLLSMCGAIPYNALEKEWKEVFGDKPIPSDIVQTSGSSVQLRLKKLTSNK